MKKPLTLLFGLLFYCSFVYAQSNILVDTSGVPNISNPMVICGGDKTFSISISNVTTSTLSNVYITYDLPTGLSYSSGSLVGTGVSQSSTSNLNKPVFLITSLLPGNINTFTISVSANCDVLTVIDNADSLKANLSITYIKGVTSYTETHKSTSITVLEPNLTLQVSNNSITANMGDTISRGITITNGGSGYLSNVEFYVVTGSDVDIVSLNNGNYTVNGDTTFISFSSTEIMKYGDGDGLFEQNEIISFSEKVVATGCVNLQSNYTTYWGCNNVACQTVNAYANISITGSTPNFSYLATAIQSGCYDSSLPNNQQLRVINTGNGPATNIEVSVYQARSAAYSTMNFFYSYIDDTSFTYKYGAQGNKVKPIVDSTLANTAYSCFLSSSPKAYVRLQIPYLGVGDTLYINWDVYTCCISLDDTSSNQFGMDREINGWNYEVAYDNQCGTKTFQSGVKNGRPASKTKLVSQTSDGPADLNDGDTATYSFSTPTFVLLPGETNKWYFAFEFLIPECLKAIDNSVTFIDKSGWAWPADSIVNHDSIVTAYFGSASKPGPFKYSNIVTTSIDMTLDCGSCSANGEKELTMNTYYIPSPSCNCESELGSVTATINTHCAIACDSGGIWTYGYDIYRTSFGLPDNDNNGVPDSTGTLIMDSINYRTVMYHDTLSAFFKATVVTTTDNPSWKYVYAESTFSDEDVAALDATLTLYDFSAKKYYTCTNIPYSQKDDTLFTYYLSIDSLTASGCVGSTIPVGFEYQNGDSIWFTPRYVVIKNVGNDTYTTFVDNAFYASNISLPDTTEARYSCDNYSGYYNITGFVMDNFGPSEVVTGACDSTTIDQLFRMSIGPCCTNYSGGNMFPYEYRPWTYVKYVKMLLPSGYKFASATYTYNQTGGTGKKLSTVTNIIPDSIISDTVYFMLEKYYQEFGGNSFSISDDGYDAWMSCVILPSCAITPNTVDTIKWYNGFEPANNYIKGYEIPNIIYIDPFNLYSDKDNVTSTVPDLSLTPTLSIIQGTDLTASWNFTLSNNSIYSGANNAWVAFKSQSGNISIQYIVNTATNDTIYPVGDIFQLGNMNIASLINLNAVCTYTTCEDDSIEIYTGWNCDSYPLSLSSSSCFSENTTLYLDPQPSKIDLEITGSPTNIDLCDTATYVVKVSSIQLGALQNITVTAQIPYGIYLYGGSSELLYPNSGLFAGISDPDSLGNGYYQWNIDANSIVIDSFGLTGIADTTENYFKLKFDVTTNCDFVSGFVVNFTARGEYACGPISTLKTLSSLPLEINGAPQKQYTSINFSVDNSTLCDSAIKCQVIVLNLGPSTNLSSSHYVFQLPTAYDYVNGSFVNVLNSGTMVGPAYDTLNNQVLLDWTLPSYIAAGDSAMFEFYITENTLFSCSQYMLNMFTAQTGNVLCVATGDSCSLYFLSASAAGSIDKDQMNLDLIGFTATSKKISTTQDALYINVSLENTGAVAITDSIFVNIYYDADNSNSYSTGDYYLGYSSSYSTIVPNSILYYNDTLTIASGYTCALIAVVNTAGPGLSCACLSDEMTYSIPLPIELLGDKLLCSYDTVLIGVSPTANLTYSWSPSFGLSDSTISQPYVSLIDTTPGTDTLNYVLTISNNLGGCDYADTMQVFVNPLPVADIAAIANLYCSGDTVTLNYGSIAASNMYFSWNFGGGSVISGSGSGPYQVVFSGNGTTNVSLHVTQGTCSSDDTISVQTKFISNFINTNDTTACSNSSVNLYSASGYISYLWSNGDTSNSTSVSTSGIYWVQVSDGMCFGKDSINLSIFNIPTSNLNGTDSIFGCTNEVIIGPLSPNYTYIWSNGSTNDSIVVSSPGYYWVTTDNGKCQSTDSIYVDFSSMIDSSFGEFQNELTICDGETIEVSANDAQGYYIWSTGDTTQVITISQAGQYWVQLGNKHCKVSDTLDVKNISNENFTIGNVFTPNNDGLNELFYAHLENINQFHITIWNRWGKQVFESSNKDYSWNGEIGGKKVEQGTFFWTIVYTTECNPDRQISKNGFVELIVTP